MLVDALSLYVAILLLSAVEGFRRIDPPSRLWRFRSGRLAVRRPNTYPGSGSWGWQYQFPFLPGTTFATHLLPIALDGEGITTAGADFVASEKHTHVVCSYEQAVSTDQRDLVIGEHRFRCQSPRQALRLSALITRLRPLSPSQREAEIRQMLATSCNSDAAAKSLQRLVEIVKALHRLGTAQQLQLVLLFPIVAAYLGVNWAVVISGSVAILFNILIALLFHHNYCELNPGSKSSPKEDLFRILIYPIAAVHAAEQLAQDALSHFHPVAFGAKLIGAEELRRIRYRLPGDGLAAEQIRTWFMTEMQMVVEGSLAAQSISLAAVRRKSDSSLSYCPRCESEFVFASGPCPDCPGRVVIPF